MSSPARLDPSDARPLTSREIAKVLCSMLGGIMAADPQSKDRVPTVVQLARDRPTSVMRQDAIMRTTLPKCSVSWEVAFVVTISGLRGWCAPAEVDTALAWVSENVHLIYPGNVTLPS